MAKQEISRKMGFAIQGEEEQLRVQLEAIQAELNAPTQFKVSPGSLQGHSYLTGCYVDAFVILLCSGIN